MGIRKHNWVPYSFYPHLLRRCLLSFAGKPPKATVPQCTHQTCFNGKLLTPNSQGHWNCFCNYYLRPHFRWAFQPCGNYMLCDLARVC
jgi:hypothetical protein